MKKIEIILLSILSLILLFSGISLIFIAFDEDLLLIIPSIVCIIFACILILYVFTKTVFNNKYIFNEDSILIIGKNNEKQIIIKKDINFVTCIYSRDKLNERLLKVKFKYNNKNYSILIEKDKIKNVYSFLNGLQIEKKKENYIFELLILILELIN